MSTPVIPCPEYAPLTEAEVLAALRDPDGNNPIAIEFAKLTSAGYRVTCAAEIKTPSITGRLLDAYSGIRTEVFLNFLAHTRIYPVSDEQHLMVYHNN